MTDFLKLANAGDTVTMRVTKCALATFGTYPGLVFSGEASGKEVHVEIPRKSAERQLTRESLTAESVVGKVVEICREANAQNPAKPWWALYVRGIAAGNSKRLNPGDEAKPLPDSPFPVNQETGAPPRASAVKQDAPAKAATPGPGVMEQVDFQTKGKAAAIEAAYLALFDRVARHVAKMGGEPGEILYSIDTVNAATATIFIEQCRRGLV